MTKRLLLSLLLALPLQAAEWEKLPPLPTPNGGFICGAEGSKIVIVGGTNWEGGTKNWLRAIYEFDPAKMKWEKAKDLQEGPYAYGTSFQNDSHLTFIGGTDGQRPLRLFAAVDGIKTVMSTDLELPRTVVLAAGGYVNGKYILVGGTDNSANIAGVTRMTHAVEVGLNKFQVTRLPDYPGKPFAVAAAALVGAELLVFGGMNYDSATQTPLNSSEAFAFSPANNIWRKLQPLGLPNRGLTAVALDEQHIYLAGGFTDSFTKEAWIYDVKSDSYRSAKPLPYAAMVGLVKHDGFVYCLGGEDKMKSRTDKFFRIPAAELLK